MVTYGHYYHAFTRESTETANPRSSPGLSADLMQLYQTPQPLQMTPVQLNRELGAPSSQVTVLSVSQHFMLFTHTHLLVLPFCQCWQRTAAAFWLSADTYLLHPIPRKILSCAPVCVQYCWLLAVKERSVTAAGHGVHPPNVAET